MLSAVETPGIPWPAPVRKIDDRCPIRKALVLSSASASHLHARWAPGGPPLKADGQHQAEDQRKKTDRFDGKFSCFPEGLFENERPKNPMPDHDLT